MSILASIRQHGTPVAVDIFGEWVPAAIRAEPLYDPTGERVRA